VQLGVHRALKRTDVNSIAETITKLSKPEASAWQTKTRERFVPQKGYENDCARVASTIRSTPKTSKGAGK
jgi:hypothetical protein